jgi:hypothetical protein
VTLLQREVLEAKAVGGASTVEVERRNEQYLDGAQRAVQWEAGSRDIAFGAEIALARHSTNFNGAIHERFGFITFQSVVKTGKS